MIEREARATVADGVELGRDAKSDRDQRCEVGSFALASPPLPSPVPRAGHAFSGDLSVPESLLATSRISRPSTENLSVRIWSLERRSVAYANKMTGRGNQPS